MAPLKTTPRINSSLPSSVSVSVNAVPIKDDVYESARDNNDDQRSERQINYAILRDALSGPIIQRLALPVTSSSSGSDGGGIKTRSSRRRNHRRRTIRGGDDGDGRSEPTHATTTTATSGIRRGVIEAEGNGKREVTSRDDGENVDDLVDFIDVRRSFSSLFSKFL